MPHQWVAAAQVAHHRIQSAGISRLGIRFNGSTLRRLAAIVAVACGCALMAGGAATADAEPERNGHIITIEVPQPREIEAVKDLLEADDLEGALNLASRIEKPRYRIISLGYVAEAYALNGEVERAEATAATLDRKFQRDWVLLYAVLGVVNRSGDAATIGRLIETIEGAVEKARALCLTAVGQIVRGHGDEAVQTVIRAAGEASHIVEPYPAAEVNGWITALYDELGRPSTIEAVLDKDPWFGGPGFTEMAEIVASRHMHQLIRGARASLSDE